MIRNRLLGTLGALSAVLAACGGGSINGDEMPGGGGPAAGSTANPGNGGGGGNSPSNGGAPNAGSTSTAGSGNNTSTMGGSGNAGAGSGGTTSVHTCAPGVPGSTQIPRMLNRQYAAVVRDLLGVTSVGGKPVAESLNADFDGAMLPDAWKLYQETAAAIAHDVMGNATNKGKFISCDPAATDCLKTTITNFGRKAFRRPLTDAEVTRFLKLGQTTPAGTPAEVAETTLQAFLESPSFILLPELSTTDAAAAGIPLSSYEVATRLSFFLWGTVPDDMLNAAADGKMLSTKEQILAQATRMVANREKTAPLIASFHRNWAQMDNGNGHWWKIDHDTAKFPLYNANAKAVYQSEIDNFFQEIAFGGGSFKDLFTSNIGFVNKDNAAIYGLDPAAYSTELKKVTLDSAQRPGFMTRVGFLSSYSHFADTSPILRGAFITVNLLGVDPGPPAPGATMKSAPPGNYTTNREKTDALVNQEASCQGCHVKIINPSGYVLESYDSIGKWQTKDPLGGDINATATVMFSKDNSKEISSPLALMQEIAQTPKNRAAYAQNWVSYAYGRDANDNDQCVVDQLNTKLSQSGYTILNVLSDLTQADSFRLRVRENP